MRSTTARRELFRTRLEISRLPQLLIWTPEVLEEIFAKKAERSSQALLLTRARSSVVVADALDDDPTIFAGKPRTRPPLLPTALAGA